MATTTTATANPTCTRPPTLPFPSLHLDSFNTLSAESFHTSSPASRQVASTGVSPVRSTIELDDAGSQTFPTTFDLPSVHTGPNTSHQNRLLQPSISSFSSSSRSRLTPPPILRDPVRSPTRRNVPPPLPPPQMALPPLPSPVSPLKPPSPYHASFSESATKTPDAYSTNLRQRSDAELRSSSLAYGNNSSVSLRRLGSALTIHIPGKVSTSFTDDKDDDAVVMRESPLPRRRTIVSGVATMKGSPVRVSSMISPIQDSHTENMETTNTSNPDRDIVSTLPMSFPQPMVNGNKVIGPISPRRLERKPSTNDLKQTSPISPHRRSLPRPPKDGAGQHQTQRSVSGPPPQPHQPLSVQAPPPHPTSTWPPPSSRPAQPQTTGTASRSPNPDGYRSLSKSAISQQQPEHNSAASSLPIIAGLADAGPYPSSPAPRQMPLGASPAVGLGLPPPKKVVPQEEVCLECLMRDRDLADVDVVGEGVWDRESDADWHELQNREMKFLRSMGSFTSNTHSIPSLDDGPSSDSESTSASFPSTGNSVEDAEARRRIAARREMKEAMRGKIRALDRKVVEEVGWRGFKWEEGPGGEGLPRRFRGTQPGRLTESGIKAIMTKFPSASAHRYATLQHYLKQQWALVTEVRHEAQRLGHYPFPEEPTSTWSVSTHEVDASTARKSSSVVWDRRPLPSISSTTASVTVPLKDTSISGNQLIRPSPSSPADLASMGIRPRQLPSQLQRPLTQLTPNTESLQPGPRRSHGRLHGRPSKTFSSPSLLDASPQLDDFGDDEDPWGSLSPAETGLRPFSFAVRAGAAAARDGSEGHGGRRSLWGRWGGSVTSFFGGSQGGSGSMMDMHLGLEQERHQPTIQQLNDYPRAVSMASPPRPSFFSRGSRASSIAEPSRDRELPKSMSSSRLSQVMRAYEVDPPTPEKDKRQRKKSFAGLFKRLKPKKKSTSDASGLPSPNLPQEIDLSLQTDLGAPLKPPPPISMLVSGERQHGRNRSGSSSSMLTDISALAPAGLGVGMGKFGTRSVSVPLAGSFSGISGSDSISPTSSRYAARRESYASGQGRRQSGTLTLNDDDDRRGSIVEVLAGGKRNTYASPEPTLHQFEDASLNVRPQPTGPYNTPHLPQHHHQQQQPSLSPHFGPRTEKGLTLPSQAFGMYTKPSSSMSNSSVLQPTLETPPAIVSVPFFSGPKSPALQSTGAISPNRFKNLPPLPIPDPDSSPESDSSQPIGVFSTARGYTGQTRSVSLPRGNQAVYGTYDSYPGHTTTSGYSSSGVYSSNGYNPDTQINGMNGNHNNHMSGIHGNGVMGINGRNMNGPNGMKSFDRQGMNGKPQRHVQSTYSPQPRTSFDTTPERPRQEIAQRMVTSMYDPSPVGSGPVLRVGGGGPYGFELSHETGGKGNKPRKGLKGLFGGHKAGRLA